MVLDFKTNPSINKALIYAIFEDWLKRKKFVALPQLNQFRKATDKGFQNIFFTITNYDDGLMVDINLGIRIDIIENTAYQFTNGLKGFAPASNTAITHPKKINSTCNNRYFITTQEDLSKFEDEFQLFMLQYGFEFLNFLNEPEFLDAQFNGKPQNPSIISYNVYSRIYRGLVIAKLYGFSNFDDLSSAYEYELSTLKAPSLYVNRFHLLLDYLRLSSFN